MKRTKITISLSKKALELIDEFARTTGFESRSRVIDEAIFTITKLLAHEKEYQQIIQATATKQNSTEPTSTVNVFILMDMLSKWTGILETFERFPVNAQTEQDISKGHRRKKYRKATSEEPNKKPKRRVRRE